MDSNFGPDELIACYRRGVFPMSDHRQDMSLFLVEPEMRGILPLSGLKISRSMQKFRRKTALTVSFDRDFPATIRACAENHDTTWISHGIEALYTELHERGDAHSVEVWDRHKLVGGLYGVTQGGAFFGESMFSHVTNASKLALIHLVEHLNTHRYTLLDMQFLTEHLASLGGVEVERADYLSRLEIALQLTRDFAPPPHGDTTNPT